MQEGRWRVERNWRCLELGTELDSAVHMMLALQTKYESYRIMETCTGPQKVTEARHCVAGSDSPKMSLRDHCLELR